MSEFSQIMEIIGGYWSAKTLLVANQYDIFTYLYPDGGTSGSIARLTSTNPDAVERLLNALVAMGMLKKKKQLLF